MPSDGHHGDPGRLEGAVPEGVAVPQDEDARADEDEGRQGADVAQVGHLVEAGEGGGDGHEERP